MKTYTTLAVDLSPALSDHQIVRIEHELLAKPLLVTAHLSPKAMTKKEADDWARSLTLGGFSWKLPDAEEASFIPNRAIYPCFDPKIFIGARNIYPAIWTSTPDPEDAASVAFVVNLYGGYVNRFHHDNRVHALAVRAGQPLGFQF